jgi:hypothetical protein
MKRYVAIFARGKRIVFLSVGSSFKSAISLSRIKTLSLKQRRYREHGVYINMARNYEEHIKAAELQLANKDNNPTVNNLLIDLHKGINYYKEKAERLEADLKQAEADMKEVLLGEDICSFCKNKISNEVCEGQDCDCSQCTVDCACKLCSFDSEPTCNFKWRGRV